MPFRWPVLCVAIPVGGLIPDRSSQSVINFMTQMWLPPLGAPRQIVADQGREFVSQEFADWCASRSVLLWHAAVQAPCQNGLAERSGGILKALVSAVVKGKVVIGDANMRNTVAEACDAYNQDPNAKALRREES